MYYVGIPDPSSVCAHMILCIIIPNMLETESGGDDGEDGTDVVCLHFYYIRQEGAGLPGAITSQIKDTFTVYPESLLQDVETKFLPQPGNTGHVGKEDV